MYKLDIFIHSEPKSFNTDILADTIEACKAMSRKAITDMIRYFGIRSGTYDLVFEITQAGEYVDRDETSIKINEDGTYAIDLCDEGFDKDENGMLCRYFVYDSEDDCESDGFEHLDDAIGYAKKHNFPVVKVHNYFYDESKKNKT